jgi:alkanesulfonate monooxygenase SsuD/methylene tetrahydromethanopterin reductase-like flavin-dependent oxidoreductase (luciferase family)
LTKELAGIDGVSGHRLTVGLGVGGRMVAPYVEAARVAWKDAGREGDPRLVALGDFALGDVERGRTNVEHYYDVNGEDFSKVVVDGVSGSPQSVKDAVQAYTDLGADELILIGATDDVDEVSHLAEIVL